MDSLLNNINNKDISIEEDNIKYTVTTSDNQNSFENNNISSIKLGECETKLKKHYNISDNETLLIFKVDIFEEGLLIPIIEYEVYNFETKEKLNLDICKDINIDIYIPAIINENKLNQYNSSSEYYNDLCYAFTTENGTDISISDRRKEFTKNNMSLCESNCNYEGYNTTTKKVLCKCQAKN